LLIAFLSSFEPLAQLAAHDPDRAVDFLDQGVIPYKSSVDQLIEVGAHHPQVLRPAHQADLVVRHLLPGIAAVGHRARHLGAGGHAQQATVALALLLRPPGIDPARDHLVGLLLGQLGVVVIDVAVGRPHPVPGAQEERLGEEAIRVDRAQCLPQRAVIAVPRGHQAGVLAFRGRMAVVTLRGRAGHDQ